MPRKKSDFTPVANTEINPIDLIITWLSSVTPSALGDNPGTLDPVKLAVGNVTYSGLNGGSVTFSLANLPLKAVNTLLDMLQKK